MGIRLTIALLVLVVLGAASLWWDDESRTLVTAMVTGTALNPPPEEIVALLAIDPAAVATIELRHGDQRRSMRRSNGVWTPAAATRAAETFLLNLGGVGRIGVIDVEDEELGDFGLAPAAKQFALGRMDGTPSVRVDLGKTNPPGTAIYVRLDGTGPIILAGAVLQWEYERLFEALGEAPAPD